MPNKPIWTLFTHTLKGNARKFEQSFKAALIEEIQKLETRKQQEGDTIETLEAIKDTESPRITFQNKETEKSDQIDFTDYALLRKLISREYNWRHQNSLQKSKCLHPKILTQRL